MNPVDPRWLEILKASSWQIGAISVALIIFWLLLRFEVLPPINSPWVVYGLPLAILITGTLALFGILEFIAARIREKIGDWREQAKRTKRLRQEQEAFRKYIPFMTDDEKRILGYLLQSNQKTFTAPIDGGRAATLLGRGYIRIGVRGEQMVNQLSVPFFVPDHLWEVLEEHEAEFPQDFPENGPRPWSIHWMAR